MACQGDATAGAQVFVIDMSNHQKADTVNLSFSNPIDMVVDIDRKVWVYCDGAQQALVKLDREFVTETLDKDLPTERDTTYLTNEPVDFVLGDKLASSPNPLTVSRDGRVLYYVYGKLCSNTVYIEPGSELSKSAAVIGDYDNTPFAGVDFDGRTNRVMALSKAGKLVVLGRTEDGLSTEEEYEAGSNPIMTVFNF
ncbi:hypothetical protein [Carboxylicivirga taeanensis]|uniref:hypothetical protein n=1 Tax=Carboxylicivirga taeanensis TaxID=1416875 RepID=UPI003F6DFEC7